MNNKLILTSEIPPSVNHYLGHRSIMKHGKPVSVSYITNEAKNYKRQFSKYVADEAKKQGWKLTDNKAQHFYVDTYFYFDRTDKDPNNYYKLILDAITDSQSVWIDDNVTCERVQGIYYDKNNPRIELIISPVSYIGVFKNASQLAKFQSQCVDCSRYDRNCNLLVNAISGRIQPEIHDLICDSRKAKKGKE